MDADELFSLLLMDALRRLARGESVNPAIVAAIENAEGDLQVHIFAAAKLAHGIGLRETLAPVIEKDGTLEGRLFGGKGEGVGQGG